jgi:hypothetical protein
VRGRIQAGPNGRCRLGKLARRKIAQGIVAVAGAPSFKVTKLGFVLERERFAGISAVEEIEPTPVARPFDDLAWPSCGI